MRLAVAVNSKVGLQGKSVTREPIPLKKD